MRDALLALRLERWVLPALLGWPIAGALLTFLVGRTAPAERAPDAGAPRDVRAATLAVLLVEALLALGLWAVLDPGVTGWQATVDLPLVARWGARVSLGVDGMSLVMVLLATLLPPLAVIGSPRGDAHAGRGYHALLLLLTGALVGVLVTLDLLLLSAFWALLVVATFLAIRASGEPAHARAARGYLALAGTTALLLCGAVGLLWLSSGGRTFDLDALLAATRGSLSVAGQLYLFAAFVLAFAAAGAVFPLHGWLPGAVDGAPPSLAAALTVPVGAYGMLRFALPFFPSAAAHPTLRLGVVALAIVGVVYCAIGAARERTLARAAAYAAVAHAGLALLGIFSLEVDGVQGALAGMLARGVALGALFLLSAAIHDRAAAGQVGALAGSARRAPVLAAAVALAALALVGLPGTGGFVGARLVILGAYRAYPVAAVIAGVTALLAAAWLLRALRGLVAARVNADDPPLADLDARERVVVGVLAVAIVWLGVAPGPVLRRTEGAARRVVEQVTRGAAAVPIADATGRDGGR